MSATFRRADDAALNDLRELRRRRRGKDCPAAFAPCGAAEKFQQAALEEKTPETFFAEVFPQQGDRILWEALHGNRERTNGALLASVFRMPAHIHLNRYAMIRAMRDICIYSPPGFEKLAAQSLSAFKAELASQKISLRDALKEKGRLPDDAATLDDNAIIERAVMRAVQALEGHCEAILASLADTEVPEYNI